MEAKDWLQKGDDWCYKGEYHQAIDCFNKAIELKPDYVEAYGNKGLILAHLGEYQQAINCYDKAIK